MIWMRGAERGYIDHFIAAFLLNTIFLVKISGLVIGLAIVVVGLILRGPTLAKSRRASLVVLLFLAVMVVLDFIVTGTSLYAVIQEYGMAAQGRVGAISALDILWFVETAGFRSGHLDGSVYNLAARQR